MSDKVIKLVAPPPSGHGMIAAHKAATLEYLREKIEEVEADEIEAIFCVCSHGPEGTSAFRAGLQSCELLGRIEHFKHDMMEGME